MQDAANVRRGIGEQDPDAVSSRVDDIRGRLNTVVRIEDLDANALVVGKRAGRFQETTSQAQFRDPGWDALLRKLRPHFGFGAELES